MSWSNLKFRQVNFIINIGFGKLPSFKDEYVKQYLSLYYAFAVKASAWCQSVMALHRQYFSS